MFWDWKNQYCENDYTYPKQSADSMQSLSNYHGILHKTRKKKFTTCMETQKTLNSHSNFEKEKWKWRNEPS